MREQTAAYLVALAEATRDLGGDLMVFGSPKQRSLLAGVTRGTRRSIPPPTRSARRCRASRDAGVTLCMEPLAPAETDFINTCAEAHRLADAVDHPSFVLHLDVKAMSSEADADHRVIRALRAAHWSLSRERSEPARPGFGDVDFVPIFGALEEAGYDGWVSVEVFDYKPDPETIAGDP